MNSKRSSGKAPMRGGANAIRLRSFTKALQPEIFWLHRIFLAITRKISGSQKFSGTAGELRKIPERSSAAQPCRVSGETRQAPEISRSLAAAAGCA